MNLNKDSGFAPSMPLFGGLPVRMYCTLVTHPFFELIISCCINSVVIHIGPISGLQVNNIRPVEDGYKLSTKII